MTVSSAGHPRPLILRGDGKVEDVDADGTLLGMFDDPTLATSTWSSPRATRWWPTPTGSPRSARATSSSARVVCARCSPACAVLPADELAERIVHAVEAFRPEPPADDIAVLALRAVRASEGDGVA